MTAYLITHAVGWGATTVVVALMAFMMAGNRVAVGWMEALVVAVPAAMLAWTLYLLVAG